MQQAAFDEVPYDPIGQYRQPAVMRGDLAGVINGTSVFRNVRRS